MCCERWLASTGHRSRPPQLAKGWLVGRGWSEIVAVTCQAMGLLPAGRRPGWYDPGRLWSGDNLHPQLGAHLGAEVAVEVPVHDLADVARDAERAARDHRWDRWGRTFEHVDS